MNDFMHFSEERQHSRPSSPLSSPAKRLSLLCAAALASGIAFGAAKKAASPKPSAKTKATAKKATAKKTTKAAATAKPAASGLKPFTESIPDALPKFDMVPIPGGTLTYSDASGAKKTAPIKPFWIGKTEMTWDVYDIFAYGFDLAGADAASGAAISRPSRPYGPPDRGFGHQNYPVISETYYAAEQFCEWLSAKTKHKYRLPTELEWEYACRAGAASSASMEKAALDKVAWYQDNSGNKSHPAGGKAPNAWGLNDMLGNVMEWCKGADDKPVARGGSWLDTADKVNCATRFFQNPSWNSTDPQFPKSKWWLSDGNFVGFRVVREE
jgi:formylglycine-generating enzyme required for sulfatase activity